MRGVSQVVLQESLPCAVLILLAVAWTAYDQHRPALFVGAAGDRRRDAERTAARRKSRAAAPRLVGADQTGIVAGLYSFSAVLTAIALGAAFGPGSKSASSRVKLPGTVCVALGVAATVVVQAALDTVLKSIGIPALTMPFVLTTWLFLLARHLAHG